MAASRSWGASIKYVPNKNPKCWPPSPCTHLCTFKHPLNKVEIKKQYKNQRMYVMSIVLCNSQRKFVLKIKLFRCNVNETSINYLHDYLNHFHFSFLSKKSSKMKNIQSKCVRTHQVWTLSLCTHPYAFLMTRPSP